MRELDNLWIRVLGLILIKALETVHPSYDYMFYILRSNAYLSILQSIIYCFVLLLSTLLLSLI